MSKSEVILKGGTTINGNLPEPPPNPEPIASGMVLFSQVKPYLSDKPLRRPSRSRPLESEDEIDRRLAAEARAEGGCIPHEDVMRELGW